MELVEIPVGDDGFRAQFLSDVCTGEGIDHELLLSVETKSTLRWAAPHRLLVHYDDLDDVERIIDDHFPAYDGEVVEHHQPTRSAKSRRLRLLLGVPMLALFLAVILAVVIAVFELLA